ncbi:MAG: cellulose synthase operon protein YhjQ/BcsQ [Pirellulaceae bacterium]|jgi:Mrp family chromosome partitioning ATPase
MSSMNQAFLRAFAKQQAAQAARATHHQSVAGPSESKATQAADAPRADVGEAIPSEVSCSAAPDANSPIALAGWTISTLETAGIDPIDGNRTSNPQALQATQGKEPEVPKHVDQPSELKEDSRATALRIHPEIEDHPPVEVAESTSQSTSFQSTAFQSTWEVDGLQWPEMVLALEQHRSDLIDTLGWAQATAHSRGARILWVTSPQARSGRSTIACTLARAASMQGLKTLLIDGDFEHTSLAQQMHLEATLGWEEALEQRISLEEAAIHSLSDQLTLLPRLEKTIPESLLACPEAIAAMLDRLTESFDWIVIDGSPLDAVSLPLWTFPDRTPIDAAIVVMGSGAAEAISYEAACEKIAAMGIESTSRVDNFVLDPV